ncbi:helicase HerA-like domain-containing protein [Actinomyces faecalis]|uniref:helicase HerA-like domain-containing protein n=1 Tax=Actinomyces faecalis TaxID=2722820 RepID=UPI00155245F5|nr:helicase HerA-like domain-containing protein [Actinomyces faecalis]
MTDASFPARPGDPSEVARLKVAAAQAALEAAEAAAQAARARAAAAQAALEEALAAPQAAPVPALSTTPEAAPQDGSYAAQVASGYTFTGPVLPIGTYLSTPTEHGGTPAAPAEPAAVPGVRVGIPLGLLNRHALVTGATGTGKTRTLQLMAEGLSAAGVPVFLSDVKGDLTGLAEPGTTSDRLAARVATTGQPWAPQGFPVELFSLGGQGQGVPIRTTVTEFGPVMLSRVLNLSETQTAALRLVFRWADEQGLVLVDLGDLRDVVSYLTTTDEGKAALRTIGGVSSATAGVILRQVTALEADGADRFFGEPAMDVGELMRTTVDGRGVISALELEDVQSQAVLFSTFLIWLLGELFEGLPEVGDLERPRLVFFLDEAHLLFDQASPAFLEAVTHTVRLIRSKGVGIVLITQSATDLPAQVLAQLGSRVQHAVRAHTPIEAANLKKVVATFPTSPLDLPTVLQTLGTGQAVVSVLDEKGRPAPVAPVVVDAPASVMGPAQASTVSQLLADSALLPRYAEPVNPDSASEALTRRLAAAQQAQAAEEAEAARRKEAERAAAARRKEAERLEREAEKAAERERRAAERAAERRQREIDKTLSSIGRQVTRELTRSVLGNLRRR